MAQTDPPPNPRRDADGVVEVRTGRRSPVMLVSGAVLAASLAGIGWLALRTAGAAPTPRPDGTQVALGPAPAGKAIRAEPPAASTARRPARTAVPADAPALAGADPPAVGPAGSAAVQAGDGPGADPVSSAQDGPAPPAQPHGGDPGGAPTGIAAFPPLGTKPILRGIVVPDGFELPPGYVRHYQATDDGRMLPPVLRFHPDHPPLDASGKPIPVAPGGLVPPEWAPPGLPIEYLDVPGAAR